MYRPLDQDQQTAYDCVPTTSSMGCDGATAGVKRPSQLALRRATGIPYPYGISYVSMANATESVAGVKAEARYGLSRYQVMAIPQGGRDFGISIDCSVTRYTTRRTGYFTGNHTVFVPAGGYSVHVAGDVCGCEKRTQERHSEFQVQDPGTFSVGYLQWSAELLFAAAEARTYNRGINVLVFPDRTDVYRLGKGSGWVRSKPSSEGAHVKRVGTGKYHVLEIVWGEAWWRPDGGRSNAWYRTPAGYIRGDKLHTGNVAA